MPAVDTEDAIENRFRELFEQIKHGQKGSEMHDRALAELDWQRTVMQFRTTDFQARAAKAEEKAAAASERAAEATAQNARYMLWSVIAAAVSPFGSLASAMIAAFSHH
jgi:DNA topoisomerase IB